MAQTYCAWGHRIASLTFNYALCEVFATGLLCSLAPVPRRSCVAGRCGLQPRRGAGDRCFWAFAAKARPISHRVSWIQLYSEPLSGAQLTLKSFCLAVVFRSSGGRQAVPQEAKWLPWGLIAGQ